MIKQTEDAMIKQADCTLDRIKNTRPVEQLQSGRKLPFVKPQLRRQGDVGAITRFQIGGSGIDPFAPYDPFAS